MNRSVVIYSTMVVLFLVSATIILKTKYEWVEEEVTRRASPEAFKHRYLAARRYLDKLDVQHTDIDSSEFFYQLPSASDTILLRRLQSNLTDSAYTNLLDWIDNGGHLVFGLPYGFYSSQGFDFLEDDRAVDRFLQQLSITPVFVDEDSETEKNINSMTEQRSTVQGVEGDIEIVARYREYQFELSAEMKPDVWAEEGQGLVYAQSQYGTGRVTMLSVPQIWNNDQIGDANNALLLIQTLSDASPYSTVHISDRNTDLPGILSLLFNRSPWLCALLGVLGLALLRRSSVRFGSVLTSLKPQSANFARYLHSKTRFLEKTQTSATLLAPVRARVRRQYSSNSETELSVQEIVQRMANSTDLPKKEIYQAIFDERPAAGASLVETIKTLQAVSRANSKRAKKS